MKRVLWTVGCAGFVTLLTCMLLPAAVFTVLYAITIAGTVAAYALHKRTLGKTLVVCILSASFFSGLFCYREACVVQPSYVLEGQTVSVTGRLSEYPEKKKASLALRLERCEINGEQTDLSVILYVSKRNESDFPLYSTVDCGNVTLESYGSPGEFYYHTLSGGVWLSGFAQTASVLSVYDGHSPFLFFKQLRHRINGTLTSFLGEENGAIAAALLIGDRTALPGDFTNRLRIAGGSHLFAVSGMHLSLWAAVFFFLLRNKTRIKRLPNLLTAIFILFYMGLTGFSPSVCRAGVMLLSILIGRTIRYHSDPLNALGLAACVMLTANVYLAGNVSFLLSFAATAAIVILYPYLSKRRERKDKLLQRTCKTLSNTAALTVSVLVFTLPFSAFFFGYVSLLSPLTTILLTLPIELEMGVSAAGVLFSGVPLLGKGLFWFDGLLCRTIQTILRFLARLDAAVIPVSATWVGGWYTLTAVALLIVYRVKRKGKYVVSVLLASMILFVSTQVVTLLVRSDDYELYVPAAGNATCICFHAATSGSTVLIGTGRDYGSLRAIRSYFKEKGIVSLQTLIIPRLYEAENGNTAAFTDYPIGRVFSPSGNLPLAEANIDYVHTDNFTAMLPGEFRYVSFATNRLSAGILENDAFKAVFCYTPQSDFSDCDPSLSTGDLLLARGALPQGLDPSGFSEIIVLSDKTAEALHLPENVKTTADTGDVSFTLQK